MTKCEQCDLLEWRSEGIRATCPKCGTEYEAYIAGGVMRYWGRPFDGVEDETPRLLNFSTGKYDAIGPPRKRSIQ